MPDSRAGESVLVERAIAGDAEAFGELYVLHLDAIYRYIYYRVGDAQDAEDLTEQVFLRVWQALPGYEQRGYPFSSWLYRIAHNAVVDYHRERGGATGALPLEDWVENGSRAAALDEVISAEEAAALSAAVKQLSDDQQQVILLRFVEGMSHAQVAHIVGKSEGACRVIQHRALAALSQLLVEVKRV
jgi:RNA polymerase sigma-70 factor (ECF subfamily)